MRPLILMPVGVRSKLKVLASPKNSLGCKPVHLVSLLLIVFLASLTYAANDPINNHNHETMEVDEKIQLTNALCPVMTGNAVNPAVFTVHKGQKVYFCCYDCTVAFEKDPEKYLHLLPQFSKNAPHEKHDHQAGHNSVRQTLSQLVKPAGITTLSLLIITVSAGLLRRKKPKLLLKWHKRFGIITLVSAIVHAVLVLIFH